MVMTEMLSPLFLEFSILHLDTDTSHVITEVLITVCGTSYLLKATVDAFDFTVLPWTTKAFKDAF